MAESQLELNLKKAQEYVNDLVENESLNLTPTQKSIFKFITEKTFEQDKINEIIIASQVLHKDAKFDPGIDTSVRVHISNIRKKLDLYYNNNGKEDAFKIKIPKGAYHVIIEKNTLSKHKPALPKGNIYLYIIIGLILAFIFQFFYFQNYLVEKAVPVSNSSPFWENIVQNEYPCLVVYHDIFFYDQFNKEGGERYIIYNEKIDSKQDLDSLAETLPEQYTVKKSFDYVRYRSLEQLLEISPIIFSGGKSVEVNLLNELKPADLTNHNIIFIGKHRKMGIFQSLLEKLGFTFSFFPHQIVYHDEPTDSTYLYEMQGQWQEFHNDLGIIAKIPGPNNNEIVLLTSLHAVGNGLNQVVQLVSDPGNFRSLQSEITTDDLPRYFFALIKVSGYEEAGFSHEVLHFGEIDKENNLWSE